MTADQFFNHVRLLRLHENNYKKTRSYADKKMADRQRKIIDKHIITQVSNYTQNKLFS